LEDDSDFPPEACSSVSALAGVRPLPFDEAEEGVNNLGLAPDKEELGEVRETAGVGILLSAIRTPDGPSTIPRVVAARIKYCIVVPVLLVLFAFKA